MKELSGNVWFIAGTLAVCLGLSLELIFTLNTDERTIPNAVTIVGTILTVGAITFSIREQLAINKTSKEIKKSTGQFKERLILKSIHFHYNMIWGKCLEDMGRLPDAKLTHKRITTLHNEINTRRRVGLDGRFDVYIRHIEGYSTELMIGKFKSHAIPDKDQFFGHT